MARTGTIFVALVLIFFAIILFSVAPATGSFAGFLLSIGILCVAIGIIVFILVVLEQYTKGKAEQRG